MMLMLLMIMAMIIIIAKAIMGTSQGREMHT
jgi:hypothetical protein